MFISVTAGSDPEVVLHLGIYIGSLLPSAPLACHPVFLTEEDATWLTFLFNFLCNSTNLISIHKQRFFYPKNEDEPDAYGVH